MSIFLPNFAEVAAASEQRKLCEAVHGTDICVSGGGFACMCNECTERSLQNLYSMQAVFDSFYLETV